HELPPYRRPAAAAQLAPALLRAQGRALYFKSCAHCHGTDMSGEEGPDLHGLEISDRRIATVIQRGIKGEMPSFARKHSAAEVAALVAFVRSLQ
ncbi:MAG TPA: cytochrome c, partial [Opitutaceae bacterium]|nr:cytochrome c [Opitutaceae bacterium]